MGKSAKARRKNMRADAKKVRKASKKAQYLAFAQSGQRKKSKRFLSKGKKSRLVRSGADVHPINCGNPGCKKCFLQYQRVIWRKVV